MAKYNKFTQEKKKKITFH